MTPTVSNLALTTATGQAAAPHTRTSPAAIASVLGALLLLFACALPLLHTPFVIDGLMPALLPEALATPNTATMPRTTLEALPTDAVPTTRAEPPAAQPLFDALERKHGTRGVSLAALSAALIDAQHLVAAQPAPSRGHLVALRVALATLAIVAAFAALCAAWGLARRLAPLDRLQLAAQLGIGGVLTVALGLASAAAVFDPIAATQLRIEGCLVAFLGAALLVGAATTSLRARDFLPVSALAALIVAALGALVGLGATI